MYIYLVLQAQESEARGDLENMRKNRQLALILDICGVILGAITFFAIVVAVSIEA